MEWDKGIAAMSVAAKTTAIAKDSEVTVKWPHPICSLAPFLEFRSDPAINDFRFIEYAPLASVV